MRFLILVFLIVFVPAISLGQTSDVITKFEQAWIKWSKENRIRKGAIVVTRNGKPVHQSSFGTDARGHFELASLSKAITAVCVDSLIKAGKLSYDMPLAQIFDRPIADQGLARATISQLITHSAGIAPDSTQKSMRRWVGRVQPRHDEVTKTVLKRRSQRGTPGTFFYNNENYALLGSIVERVTGEPYSKVCNRLATKNKAKVSRVTGGFAPWGGWTMTLTDYAAFHAKNFGNRRPNNKAKQPFGGGAFYGLGTFWRKSGSRHNYWHFGKHCFPGKMDAGSFSVSWQGNWGVVVGYDACVPDRRNGDLDAAFIRIVFP